MNYTLLQSTIAGIATGITTPLVAGVMCDIKAESDQLIDRGFTFYLVGDTVAQRNAEEAEVIEENWLLQVVYLGGPELWASRLSEARADARLLRNAIAAISQATLNSIADGPTTFESVTIRTGDVKHDNTRQREGILVLTLPVTVTWVI